MYSIRKKLKDFSAAHRLTKGYLGKCAHLHGHNYVATVLIGAKKLDKFDLVIDFNEVKALCDDWLQQHVDHATIIASDDQPLINFVLAEQQKHYIIPGGKSTSAEVIAAHLFEIFHALLQKDYAHLILHEVEVMETVTSQAMYRGAAL
jgi:6-pyruvoyltetrahydropterin/6-carboxytetrahydropterin synthase